MMDRLREGVNSIAVKIILGLIILSFVFAGVGSYIVGGNNNAAAKVGNTEIARGEFEMAYQNERNRMQAQNWVITSLKCWLTLHTLNRSANLF